MDSLKGMIVAYSRTSSVVSGVIKFKTQQMGVNGVFIRFTTKKRAKNTVLFKKTYGLKNMLQIK